eukprot:CAMPEP_0197261704 /NCGR_PEP_ID=MMETSP1432-20130617/107_1 /TAXON_ID=44447 /ORGANISM="Pseudo-nitzschia delicatissima, Strain UNC1205" /LENGTH=358 /DNA_ID=CAMNT_0042725985 /DNA_START=51 /DNA_END=1127 /DNA_ORIENTATION=-
MPCSKNTFAFLIVSVAHLLATCTASTGNGDDDKVERGENDEKRIPVFEDNYTTWKGYLSMTVRFGLFLFIICYPFVRGIKVWYLAGGRILFRRNDNGWIVGLRYQPPDLDRWLILAGYADRGRTGMHENNATASRKLTAEEVYALPEISAPKPSDVDIESGEADELSVTYHGNNESPSDVTNIDTINDLTVESGLELVPVSISSQEEVETDSTNESPPEQPTPTPTRKRIFTTTMSTQCSICIDDFEEGEKIRLLPRCGHAFHTDCILPWLTERQGCCPCCKADVICREVEDNEEAKEDEEENENNNSNNSGNENENEPNNNENGTAGERAASPGTGRSSYLSRGRNYYQAHPFVGRF